MYSYIKDINDSFNKIKSEVDLIKEKSNPKERINILFRKIKNYIDLCYWHDRFSKKFRTTKYE